MTDRSPVDVAVIGAGMAGLTCAQQLHQLGYRVVVLEKSRGVGGRIATRRLYGTFADHGTCYLTPQGDDRFQLFVEQLRRLGILQVWLDAIYELGADGKLHIPATSPSQRYYAAPQGMTAIAKFLAAGLDLRFSQRVTTLALPDDQGWQVTTESMSAMTSEVAALPLVAKAVVIAVPAPQAVTILQPLGGLFLKRDFMSQLESVRFQPCLSVIAGYPASCYQDWLTQHLDLRAINLTADPNLNWIGLDSSKRTDPSQPVFVLRSTASFAERWLDGSDLQPAGTRLLQTAARLAPWLANPEWMQVHRWRYAFVQTSLPQPVLAATTSLPLACAGEWCGGNRVEQAFVSGLTVADYINQQLQQLPAPTVPLWEAIATASQGTKTCP